MLKLANNRFSPKMKKYKIPEEIKEIYISEKEPPYTFINELVRISNKAGGEWKVVPRLIYLEEIKE